MEEQRLHGPLHRFRHYYSGYMYISSWHWYRGCTENLAVRGCVWAVSLRGPQAWMSHFTWTHGCVLWRINVNLVREKKAFHSHQAWRWEITLHITCLNSCDTLRAMLHYSMTLSDQFPDDPGLTQPEDESSLFSSYFVQIKTVMLCRGLECMDSTLVHLLVCARHVFTGCQTP